MKKIFLLIPIMILGVILLTGCSGETTSTKEDIESTLDVGNKLAESQPTPIDIDYSLERYNLIRRA